MDRAFSNGHGSKKSTIDIVSFSRMTLNEISNSIGGKGYTNYLQDFSLVENIVYINKIKVFRYYSCQSDTIIQQTFPIIFLLSATSLE